jgi:hypothetical protein
MVADVKIKKLFILGKSSKSDYIMLLSYNNTTIDEIVEIRKRQFKDSVLYNPEELKLKIKEFLSNLEYCKEICNSKFITHEKHIIFIDNAINNFQFDCDNESLVIFLDQMLYDMLTYDDKSKLDTLLKEKWRLKYNTWWNRLINKIKKK